jgi:hypothetical protein
VAAASDILVEGDQAEAGAVARGRRRCRRRCRRPRGSTGPAGHRRCRRTGPPARRLGHLGAGEQAARGDARRDERA